MSRSNAATISIADSSSSDQLEYQGPTESERAGDCEPEMVVSIAGIKKAKEKVPPHARLWGFVRRVEDGHLRNAELMAEDFILITKNYI